MQYVSLILGMALLVGGGEMLVRGAVTVARRMRVSPLFIGLTLVGFGTSTPELVTSVQAALAGSPGVAVGNVVGSNIANILLILGLSAILAPLACDPGALRRDGGVAVVTALIAVGIGASGFLSRPVGFALVLALVLYVVATFRLERAAGGAGAELRLKEAEQVAPVTASLVPALFLCLIGLALTIVGAGFLVDGAVALARQWGVSEAVIGLTIVAVGTSLPEFVTSVMAAVRGQGDVAFGNIIGSNIYNILGILGVTAVISPVEIPGQIIRFDLWVMLGATLVLVLFAFTGRRINRIEGAILLLCYAVYLNLLAV